MIFTVLKLLTGKLKWRKMGWEGHVARLGEMYT